MAGNQTLSLTISLVCGFVFIIPQSAFDFDRDHDIFSRWYQFHALQGKGHLTRWIDRIHCCLFYLGFTDHDLDQAQQTYPSQIAKIVSDYLR